MAELLERMATGEETGIVLRRSEAITAKYAMNLMLLQKELGLSYKEARALMIDRWETPSEMAADLDMDIHSVYNMERRSAKKLEKSGKTYVDIVGDYYMPLILILE